MKDRIVYREEDSTITLEDIKRIFGDKKVIIDNAKKIGEFIFEEYYRNVNNGLDIDFEEFLYNYEKDNRDFEFLETLSIKTKKVDTQIQFLDIKKQIETIRKDTQNYGELEILSYIEPMEKENYELYCFYKNILLFPELYLEYANVYPNNKMY